MTGYNAIHALAPDDRPATATRDEHPRPPRPDRTLGTELLIDDLTESMAAANRANADLRRARAAHDMLAINAAALEMRKALQIADALARSVQMGAARHLRREPRIRS